MLSWYLYEDKYKKTETIVYPPLSNILAAQTRLVKKEYYIIDIQAQTVHQLKLTSFKWFMPQ